jgi:hypothetical protein
MWDEGYITIEGYKIKFVVKHSSATSNKLGVDGGRVWRLRVYSPTDTGSNVYAEFDRGKWLKAPKGETAHQIVQFLLRMFN